MSRPRGSYHDAIRATLLTTTLSCAQIAPLFGVCARTVERVSAELSKEGRTRPARTFLPCGTYAAYTRGCRCVECRAANTAECRRFRVSRGERLTVDPTLQPHGTQATYTNWECRCEPCRAAAAAAWAEYRAMVKAWDEPCGYNLTDLGAAVVHGTVRTA